MPRDNYVRVKRFGVFSVAKTAALFGVAIGVILLVAAVLVAAFGGTLGLAVGTGVGVALLVASVLGLFICGAVEAFLYNVIAGAVGAVRIVLRKDVVEKVDPVSYTKVSFVFSLIVYGLLAIFVSSVLLAAIGVSSTASSLPLPLAAAAFIFALVVYGLFIPYAWSLVYNWLSGKMGGIGVVIRRGAVQRIDVWSYVKMVLVLSVIVFIIERAIGSVVALALGIQQVSPLLVTAAGFVAVVVAGLVLNALLAWFYNLIARRFGGCEVEVGR